MFSPSRNHIVLLLALVLAPLLLAGRAQAQSTGRRQRLLALQQTNALLQQQNAVQNALQQTNTLLQAAYQHNRLPQPVGLPFSSINFQQQQNALQMAQQQTNALLQVSFRQNSALSQLALRQLNTLQTALQQTLTVQSALPIQNGQLTPFQMQTLVQEQSSLMELLTSQLPPSSRRMSRK